MKRGPMGESPEVDITLLKDGDPRPDSEAARALDETWSDPPGFLGWFAAVNHKTIATRFLVTTLAFFAAGGLLAALMRMQLARPENGLVGPDLYNQVFTMHGTTMMFLFAVPVMQSLAIYLVPLMIGSRSVAFPRMNAFAYYVFLFGGLMLWIAFFFNTAGDAGWFAYPPLAGPEYGPGKRIDFWAQMITFTELASLVEAVVVIVTVFKLRAPGMTLARMPLFVWAMLVTAFVVMFAMPAVMLGSVALLLDRLVGTHFFNPGEGGDPLLWQHLFWFFGHPEVYLIFIPGLGFLSSIISTFTRRPIFGYTAMVLSLIATAFLAFGLWVHHMFATDLPELGKSFFTAASILIAVPSAVQIFCWLTTLWNGRLVLRTPMLYALSFFFILVLGGMTGLMLASVSLDSQLHDTYFVVAHLHYVLLGGAVFPLFGALYYWYPKFTGRVMGERLGKVSFWLMFVGFNVAFFPMHWLGLHGMPRRVYTYQAGMGWDGMNLLATVGAVTLATGILLTLVNAVFSARRGAVAGADPWGGGTLEWATASPPTPANFHVVPVVHGPYPLWQAPPPGAPTHVSGLSARTREHLITTVVDAELDHRTQFPSASYWPFLAAVATTALFIGVVFTPWAVVWFAAPIAIAGTIWFWPSRTAAARALALDKAP